MTNYCAIHGHKMDYADLENRTLASSTPTWPIRLMCFEERNNVTSISPSSLLCLRCTSIVPDINSNFKANERGFSNSGSQLQNLPHKKKQFQLQALLYNEQFYIY